MAYGIVKTEELSDIADAIRAKLGVQTQYKPGQMADAIESISGGGITPTGTKSITANGTYDVASFASAEVNVPQSGITPTGTKQVSVTQNGTTTEDVSAYANVEINTNVVNADYENALVALGVQSDLANSITALTTYANGVTGQADTDLSDAVHTLGSGYGGGSSYSGIETKTNSSGQITDYIFHGMDEIPPLILNNTGYRRSNSTGPAPLISFADKPTKIGMSAFYAFVGRINWSDLSEVENIGGEYALVLNYSSWNNASSDVVNLPKFVGYTAAYPAGNIFRGNSTYAPKTYNLPLCTIIPQYAWNQCTVTDISITIGSIGHGVTESKSQPFGGSNNATGTVTIYTTGDKLDAVKSAVTSGAGSGLTFVWKASEATTYNGTSYAAGDTITV